MDEKFREHYFLAARIGVLLILEVYIILSQSVLTGTSAKVFLLLALFVGVMAGKELVQEEKKWIFYGLSIALCGIMLAKLGTEFILLGILLCYELISFRKLSFGWYCIPVAMAFCAKQNWNRCTAASFLVFGDVICTT